MAAMSSFKHGLPTSRRNAAGPSLRMTPSFPPSSVPRLVPSLNAARLCTYPPASPVAPLSPLIWTGAVQVLPQAPLSPSWPVLSLPHAQALPSVVSASACVPPAATDFTFARLTRTGVDCRLPAAALPSWP